MSRRPPERADEPLRWLRAQGHDLAPLTGTDTKALLAVAAAWRLYAYTRSDNLIFAIQLLLAEMQASTVHLARDLIAREMDWSDRDRLWPRVVDPHGRPWKLDIDGIST
jgi:hypothetical protein